MKYTKEGLRVFVLYETKEATIENIRKACEKYFSEHCYCYILEVKIGILYAHQQFQNRCVAPSINYQVSKSFSTRIHQLSSFKIILYPHGSIIKFQNNSVPSWINYQVSKSFCICINQFSSFKIIFISIVRFKCFQTIYRQYEINTSVAIPN